MKVTWRDITWIKIRRGSAASHHLDMVRGLAAIAVLYSHARVLLVASSDGNPHYSLLTRLFYVLSNYGHTAVILFFLLSGSLVGGSVVQAVSEDRWSWRKYLMARGVRLYVVLLPALFLTYLWDKWGLAISDVATAVNHDTAIAIITPTQIHAHSGWVILVGNLAFLQTIFVPPYGSNVALWSLANEFWYYLIFPCLWLAAAGRLTVGRRVGYGLLGFTMLLFVDRSIAAYFPFWLLGVIATAEFPRLGSQTTRQLPLTIFVIGFCLILMLIGLSKITAGGPANVAAALSFFPVLFCILRRQTEPNWLYGQITGVLAGCSFTLYAIHLPILIFLRARFTLTQVWLPQTQSWLWVGLICTVIFAASHLLSQITEARTENIKNFLTKRSFEASRPSQEASGNY